MIEPKNCPYQGSNRNGCVNEKPCLKCRLGERDGTG